MYSVLWEILKRDTKTSNSYHNTISFESYKKKIMKVHVHSHSPWTFFPDTFLSLRRPEINTICITDIAKGASTNVQPVAQKREGCQEVTCGHHQFVCDESHISWRHYLFSSSLIFKSVVINQVGEGWWPAATKGPLQILSKQQAWSPSGYTPSSWKAAALNIVLFVFTHISILFPQLRCRFLKDRDSGLHIFLMLSRIMEQSWPK